MVRERDRVDRERIDLLVVERLRAAHGIVCDATGGGQLRCTGLQMASARAHVINQHNSPGRPRWNRHEHQFRI